MIGLAIELDERQPFERVTFSVVRHPRNVALEPTLEAYKSLIDYNPKFTTFTSEDVLTSSAGMSDDLERWITWYRGLYGLV